MKTLMEHLIEEHGELRKFRCLLDVCINSLCQLGALTSESFSKRMISAVNLLVDVHRIRLDHENIDKICCACE